MLIRLGLVIEDLMATGLLARLRRAELELLRDEVGALLAVGGGADSRGHDSGEFGRRQVLARATDYLRW